jgi:hypothetical protein
MARRKKGKENIRKLQITRGSYYISLPVDLVREFKWKEKQKVVVKKLAKGKIIISDWKKKSLLLPKKQKSKNA